MRSDVEFMEANDMEDWMDEEQASQLILILYWFRREENF